jgi:pimeloyl-ACP methyl ester carboxylesterase
MTTSSHIDTIGGAKPRSAFSQGRLVALVLIGLLVLGLGYLRFGTGDEAVSVPAVAKAGDLILEDCEYATEDGTFEADCGTLVVPETRSNPDSRLIAVPVTRIRAETDDPGEPVFRLEGGPGITNMDFEKASRFAENRDVVLVGYRGVDGSVRLDCPEVESALAHSTDFLGEKSFQAQADAFRACADRLADDGIDLGAYGLAQQVDDMEAARKALGYDSIDLLSESAGTRTALIYAWRYPESLHRSVLIGANPPGHFLFDEKTTSQEIARYAKLCSEDEGCRERTDDLAASLRRTHIPDRWLFLPIEEGNVRIASFFGLMESTSEAAPVSGPMTIDTWLDSSEGDASGFWFSSLAGDLIFPKLFVWGQYAAAARPDADAAREYFSGPGKDRELNLGYAASAFAWGGGRLVDGWPAAPDEDEYSRMRKSSVETLVVSGQLDFSTPPQVARRKLMPYLSNGRQVVLTGLGHTIDFWTYQPEASTRLISAFLESGEVDDSLYEPARVDFTPTVGHGTIAKIVVGAMLALAALTLLSLLVMALRVRWRGAYGRKGSAVLRSIFPMVLGLGGWALGVMLVLAAMPGTPVDDELVVALSVGVPIGLGIYLAWVNRDWSAATRATGFAAATGGALVGAWLGFDATEGMLALLTAIVGAAVGGNLTLIHLDVAWDRRAHDRFPG